MSLLDPSIITGAGNINDPQKTNMLRQQAMQLHQERQQMQSQNALKKLLSTPGAIDPKTGQMTPQTRQQMMAIDPDTAMQWNQLSLEDQVKQIQMQHEQTEDGKTRWGIIGSIAGTAVDAYNAAIKLGKSPDEARSAAAKARNEAVEQTGGLFSKDQQEQLESTPFNIDQARVIASTNKDWQTQQDKVAQQKIDQDKADAQAKRDAAMEAALLFRTNQRDAGKWAPYQTKEGKPFLYNETTGVSKLPDGTPFQPDSFEKPAASDPGADQPLDPNTVQYLAEAYRDTGKLPPLGTRAGTMRKQILDEAAKLSDPNNRGGAAAADSDVGHQAEVGSDKTSLNNITKIADSAQAYEKTALANMEIVKETMPKGSGTNLGPFLDRWVQTGRFEFGSSDVPPYQTALATVANEYAKVMSGSTGSQGSTVDSRKEARDMLNRAMTSDQVLGVLDVMRQDMANKQKSYRGQRSDIEDRITGKPGSGDDSSSTKAKPGDYSHLWQ